LNNAMQMNVKERNSKPKKRPRVVCEQSAVIM
jgi:hypothetical protein